MCLKFSNGLTIGPIISPNGTIMSLFLRVNHTNNAFFRLKRTERGEQANVPLKKHIFVKKSVNPLPQMNSAVNGICSELNATNKKLLWLDLDKRSKYC
jgi:hypothetical protein